MKGILTILFLLCMQQTLWAQDTTRSFVSHSPKKATNRSAILPGLGQAYNKQYWKIPLVYGVISVPVVTYIYITICIQKQNLPMKQEYKRRMATIQM